MIIRFIVALSVVLSLDAFGRSPVGTNVGLRQLRRKATSLSGVSTKQSLKPRGFTQSVQKLQSRRYASERSDNDAAATTTTEEKEAAPQLNSRRKKPENVDLFAVEDRKMPVLTTSSIGSTYKSSSQKTKNNSSSGSKKSDDIEGSSSSGSIGSSSTLKDSRASAVEMQAEKLRLEAEVELLEINRQRAEEEKELLRSIDDALLRLIDQRINAEDLVLKEKSLMRKELFFRLAELINSSQDSIERARLSGLYELLLVALQEKYPNLHVEVTAEIQKELTAELNRAKQAQREREKRLLQGGGVGVAGNATSAYEQFLQQWVSQTGNSSSSSPSASGMKPLYPIPGGFTDDFELFKNLTAGGANGMSPSAGGIWGPPIITGGNITAGGMVRFPSALPFNLIPMILRSPEISREDLNVLESTVFDDLLNGTIVDYSVYLATFRGIPTDSVEETLRKAQRRMELAKMSDRLRLFVLPEYRFLNNPDNTYLEKYSGIKYEPIFTVLPKQAEPTAPGAVGSLVNVAALAVSCFTTLIYVSDLFSKNSVFLERAFAGDDSVVDLILPIIGGVIGLQVVHDAGHAISAALNGVKISLPYFIPSLQIGIFGSITRFMSYPKTRKELFDVSIAGPTLGFMASLACTLYGLSTTADLQAAAATSDAAKATLAAFPQLPIGFFQSSFLLYQLTDSFLHIPNLIASAAAAAASSAGAAANIAGGGGVQDIANALTPIHPALAVGITGMITNAFNFMPIGKLDGGRIAMAIGGRQAANTVSFAFLLGQAFGFLTNTSPIALFWIIAVVFLQRGADLPPENDVTPIATDEEDANKNPMWFLRVSSFALCVLLTAGMLLPMPIDETVLSSALSGTMTGGEAGGGGDGIAPFLGGGSGSGGIVDAHSAAAAVVNHGIGQALRDTLASVQGATSISLPSSWKG